MPLTTEVPVSTITSTAASFDIVTVQLQFDGICETIRRAGKMAGIEYFVDLGLLLQREFNLSKEQITPKKIACNPVQIIFELRVQPASKLQVIRKRLTNLVGNGKVSFPIFVDGKMVFFNATKIVFNPNFSNNESTYSRIGLSEIDIIVISAVCSASMILVCIGFIICAREYYGKYRTRSFDLSEIDWSSKADDYTLTKIPRPKVTYSENGMKLHSIGKTSGKEMREKSSAEENETLVSSVKLRVNTDENGLTVGVTGRNILTSNQSSPSHSYHSCDNRDLSRELLVRPRDSPLHSVDNPIYYADDDRFYGE
ncbi:hypothetical protein FSP39_018971 [Pinctada imbricata]|uniref:Uncharacterized protein n=1 Tax=Pinctada imbricata TaxID=66713 RepID=A0AA88Y8I1_PINIB|nr:hypothetical protein FSP39_018971 [Pinctada imbricata]